MVLLMRYGGSYCQVVPCKVFRVGCDCGFEDVRLKSNGYDIELLFKLERRRL